eukprot:gene13690-biopygen10988
MFAGILFLALTHLIYQQFILCGDGTIRNQKVNYCITPQGLGGKWNRPGFGPCRLYPGIPKSQKWRLGRSKTFYDAGGIKQTAREIINVASGKCIDIVTVMDMVPLGFPM